MAKDPQLGSSRAGDASPNERKGGAEGQAVLLQVREAAPLQPLEVRWILVEVPSGGNSGKGLNSRTNAHSGLICDVE